MKVELVNANAEYTGQVISPKYNIYQIKYDDASKTTYTKVADSDIAKDATLPAGFTATVTDKNNAATTIQNVGVYTIAISIDNAGTYANGYKIGVQDSTFEVTSAKLTVNVDPDTQKQKAGSSRKDPVITVVDATGNTVGKSEYDIKYYTWTDAGATPDGNIQKSELSEVTDITKVGKYVVAVELKANSNYVIDSVKSTTTEAVLLYDGKTTGYAEYTDAKVGGNIVYEVLANDPSIKEIKANSVKGSTVDSTALPFKDSQYKNDVAFDNAETPAIKDYYVRVPDVDADSIQFNVTLTNPDTTTITASDGTTLTPTKVEIEATDVTKGSVAEPTTKPVPSTQPTTAQPATEPSGNAVYGDVNGDGDITVVDATLVQKHVVQLETLSADKQILADVNGDNTISVVDATLIQKYIVQLKDWGRTGDVYQAEQPTTPEPTTAEPTTVKPTAQPTTAEPTTKPADTYTLYFKTKLGWMTSDGVSLFAYDLDTGASYQFEQDTDAYPNVYTVEVPATVSNVSVYRSLSEVDEKPVGGDDGNVYNCWDATVSKTNNCITLSNDEAVSTAPYVPEQKPAFTLSRVYFDNSKAHYTDVYIYGWAESGLGNAAADMNKIAGTAIWYYDFDPPLSPGSNCFLFKDTESTWKTQTSDLTVADGKNCFRANPGSKSGGVWVRYSE